MVDNFQRIGATSNTNVGSDFQLLARLLLNRKFGLDLKEYHTISIGFSEKKNHKFDLGCDTPATIVECKSHTWTKSGNVPSAKITTWHQAMLFFSLAPNSYRKLFICLRTLRQNRSETLAEYFVRLHAHLIPIGVEIWELDENTAKLNRVVTGH